MIDAVGLLDEERFPSGYCEENDYSQRAREAGFELAVADDAYVHHAKSRSFGPDGRAELARRNYETFLDKHGRGEIEAARLGDGGRSEPRAACAPRWPQRSAAPAGDRTAARRPATASR